MTHVIQMRCGTCEGTGKVYEPHRSQPVTCEVCYHGVVWVLPDNVCKQCNGQRRYIDGKGVLMWCLACERNGYMLTLKFRWGG